MLNWWTFLDPKIRRIAYYRSIDKTVSFAPGGGGFLDYTWARINAGRWRPHGQFPSRAKLPGLNLRSKYAPTHELDYPTNVAGRPISLQSNLHFRGADLTSADLSGADFSGCYFSDAILKKANFSKGIMIGTEFDGADMRGADLSGANLTGANFERANLVGADFTGADLTNARMSRARLDRVNLTNAILEGADWHGTTFEVQGTER
jgi:uncharacterized protein YjbI with pentapeptide repeats